MKSDDVVGVIAAVNLYALAVDTQRWALFDRVFTEDAVVDFGGGAVWRDLAALKRDFDSIHAPFEATQHSTGNHVVAASGEEAHCVSYVHARFVRTVRNGGNMFESTGWYDDVLVRVADGWRIRHRVCRSTWAGGNPLVLQTMPGVSGEQSLTSLRREAAAGKIMLLDALQRP